jgi:hypothetical protein
MAKIDEAIRAMLWESDGAAFDKSRNVNQELTFDYIGKYFSANTASNAPSTTGQEKRNSRRAKSFLAPY